MTERQWAWGEICRHLGMFTSISSLLVLLYFLTLNSFEMGLNRLSMILSSFRSRDPSLTLMKDMTSNSGKLFSNKGLIRINDGKPTLLPLMVRAMRKLENIIHEEMEKVSAYEISLPILIRESLLEKSGWSLTTELFQLSDRDGKKYVLCPTNEEAITNLFSKEKLTESSLPIRFYQINKKFRDEPHAKYGLIRLKEFVMKDLYCFDSCPESRNQTYNEILEQYFIIFKRLQLPFVCANSDGGHLPSVKSHEFHFLSNVGEDHIIMCKDCGENTNITMVNSSDKCPYCSSTNINIEKGIEVGHTFNIGTTYSKMFEANFYNKAGEWKPLELSSYGLGITRILGASVEILSKEKQLRWPLSIAPYLICIITPKTGSKEENASGQFSNDMYNDLNKHFKGDVVIDDRSMFTVGRRLQQDQNLGFPFIVVIGKGILSDPPKMEIFDMNANEQHFMHPSDVVSFISNKILQYR